MATYLPFGPLCLQLPTIKWGTTLPQRSWEAFRGCRGLYLNQVDRLPRMGSRLNLFMCLDRLLTQFFQHFTLPSPQVPESRDWLTYFSLPSLVWIQHLPLQNREVEVKDAASESAGNIPEHIAAIIHQTGLLTSIPGTDFQMGQKEVNHFVVVFIGQCLLILLLCQIKRVITSTKLQIHF